jgi:hypothetical protein
MVPPVFSTKTRVMTKFSPSSNPAATAFLSSSLSSLSSLSAEFACRALFSLLSLSLPLSSARTPPVLCRRDCDIAYLSLSLCEIQMERGKRDVGRERWSVCGERREEKRREERKKDKSAYDRRQTATDRQTDRQLQTDSYRQTDRREEKRDRDEREEEAD